MKELNRKYVLHIPIHKFENNQVTRIKMDELIEELTNRLYDNNYTSFYMTNVTGHYKNRAFDEILITIFTSKEQNQILPDTIFKQWFKENNNTLKQESFAFEYNNSLYIMEADE